MHRAHSMHTPCTDPPDAEREHEVPLGEGLERANARAAFVALPDEGLMSLAHLELAPVHLRLGRVQLLVARLLQWHQRLDTPPEPHRVRRVDHRELQPVDAQQVALPGAGELGRLLVSRHLAAARDGHRHHARVSARSPRLVGQRRRALRERVALLVQPRVTAPLAQLAERRGRRGGRGELE